MTKWELVHNILESLVALGAILYACYRGVKYFVHATDFINRATDFMNTLGRNHIPHIYTRLDRIDDKLGLPRTLNTPANVIPEIQEVEDGRDRAQS